MDTSPPSQSSPPPPPQGPIEDAFKVYNPQLYRELLGASDWSQTIEKTRKAKRKALLAQHNDEEKAAIARRAAQERKAKEERDTIAAERRRQKLAEREEHDLQQFQTRTRLFFDRHAALMEHLGVLESDSAAHDARVRERLYREWESEVFLPIQMQINHQIENRAAEDARVTQRRSQQKKTASDLTSVAASDTARTCARLNGANASTQPSQPQRQQREVDGADATWSARKEAMWRDFLAEDNRRRRGHEKSGVFLHDDTLIYNPAAQRDASAIRYCVPKPGSARCSSAGPDAATSASASREGGYLVSSVDQSRNTAQALEKQYTQLAQQYQMRAHTSRTGALTSGPSSTDAAVPSSSVRVSRAAPYQNATEPQPRGETHARTAPMPPAVYEHEHARVAYRVPAQGRRASTVAEVSLRELVPRTHVPYDLAHNAFTTVTATTAGSHRASPTSTRQPTLAGSAAASAPSSSAPLMPPDSFRELVAAYAGASVRDPKSNRTAERHVGTIIEDLSTQWARTLSDIDPGRSHDACLQPSQTRLAQSCNDCDQGRRSGRGARAAVTERVMPLPLPGGLVAREEQSAPSTAVWARDRLDRSTALPTTEWGANRLPSTIYGHYVNADGSALAPSDRKVAEGAMKTENSTILFDHFDYPRGMQPQHFGKRVEVWYQL